MENELFRSFNPQVVFQEVPNEVSLAYTISGCPVNCDGCHSKDTWDATSGSQLDDASFIEDLERYQNLITCVLFFGGEWAPEPLIRKLKIAQTRKLKTCLYSGFERLPKRVKQHLDYLKIGQWISALGGLEQPGTNQKFIEVNTGKDLTYLFQSKKIK